MNDTNHILAASGLHKTYGKGPAAVHVLRGLDLAVNRGEFVAVMGPSGCGKTTLLHVLGLMTPQDSGSIHLDGSAVPPDPAVRNELRRLKIGVVFQRFNLISVLSAEDNVAMSLHVRRTNDNGRVKKLFETLNVAHVMHKKPSQMSIGEQQRVAVVRAVAHRPALLLADEPTGNLDSENAAELLQLFRRMNGDEGQTIVMITHSAEAAACADRTLRMKDGMIP